MLASELPLPASLSLFGLLIQVMVAEFISPPPEVLQISLDGKIRYKNKQEQCKKALMVFKPLMIQLTTEQGEIITVWRDSCTETEYRHLLVMVNLISDSER